MRRGRVYKDFVYLLCFSFLLSMSGFPGLVTGAEERGLPIGEMVSRGEVKFESQENVWQKVDPGHFPIFQGMRIKTEKGVAFIVLTNDSQLEVGRNSLFSFQGWDEFQLFEGQASFRIPSGSELTLRVGQLSITRPYPIQAANSPLLVSPGDEEAVGSVTLHSNGAVTVVGVRGPLSVQNQERVVLASISSGESVTIPSATSSEEQGVILAQVGGVGGIGAGGPPLGFETWGMFWLSLGAGAAAATGIGFLIAEAAEDDDEVIILPTSP